MQIFTMDFKEEFGYEEEKLLMEWFSELINPKPHEGGAGVETKSNTKAPGSNLEMWASSPIHPYHYINPLCSPELTEI
jgi:hypothetical protein